METCQPELPSRATARRRTALVGAGGLVVLLVVFAGWRGGWFRRDARAPDGAPAGPPPDPRLTFATPYLNVRPDVHYVGSAACARCHREIADSFRHHPMGRSSAPAAQLVADRIGLLPSGQEPLPGAPVLTSRLTGLEHYDAPAHDPFEIAGLEHRVEIRGDQVFHRETRYDAHGQVVAAVEAPVYATVGSGTRGRTYLIARDDALFQSPMSWYSQAGRWDLSPGYERGHTQFERPVTTGCLYCHTNAVAPVEGTANRYRPPLIRGHTIGCERCHGPGALHIAARKRDDKLDGLDPTIVNPANLEPTLRESVCEQCHLQGRVAIPRAGRQWFDYRPGLPYHLFWSVFVLPEELSDRHKSVRTVEQMHASACYRKSQGALGCISCHDPHYLPDAAEKADYYRARCLQCHGDNVARKASTAHAVSHGPALPQAPACSAAEGLRRARRDNCVACHMPPLSSSDIAHTANTDHRVPRRPDEASDVAAPPPAGGPILVHFHHDRLSPEDTGPSRDLGIALALLSQRPPNEEVARQALRLLDAALREWPDDLAALEARAGALATVGRVSEALAAYETVLTQAPDDENYLLRAAAMSERLGDEDRALEYHRRAVTVNPRRAASRTGLGRAYAAHQDWRRAAQELEASLRLDPFDLKARELLLRCYLETGQQERAREEYRRLLGFNPPNCDALRERYERRLSRTGD
jgi:Tfp pilus assembly protein PilF